MSDYIAISIFTDKYFDQAVELAKALKQAGATVKIFMSGDGVKNSKHARFNELLDIAGPENVFICEASYKRYVGENLEMLKEAKSPIEGVPYKNWVTQAKNAEFIKDADKYVVF
ncbi:hypothetical protein DRP04_03235 [Archaeoglobales archaeon]|nr:MAG: hypothetical protein B6U96_10340 [Archaeoglobales archaeon ex4484_92]RLI82749.1 MAG: hypothetical protein DRP04_03235 [Archaeoglobales archaeon]